MASPEPPPPDKVPETAATYERDQADPSLTREEAKSPGNEAGAAPAARTGPRDDVQSRTSTSMQSSEAAHATPLPAGGDLKGSMKTEEAMGWDQAPTDIKDPRRQRHPRPDGVGGSDPDSAKRDPER